MKQTSKLWRLQAYGIIVLMRAAIKYKTKQFCKEVIKRANESYHDYLETGSMRVTIKYKTKQFCKDVIKRANESYHDCLETGSMRKLGNFAKM